MNYLKHFEHLAFNVSHNGCDHCKANNERRFAVINPFVYGHVQAYLSWARPHIAAIRTGNTTGDARRWQRDFVSALHNRIYSRSLPPVTRKRANGYLDRLRGMRRVHDVAYLREFAARGASCLGQ